MSKVDYEKKHGIAVTAETEKNENNTVTVVLKNADDQVVDTYTLDAKTGIGKNEQGETVDLPQTGVNSWNVAMMVGSAFSMVMAGVWMMFRSFRRNKKRSA